jgi:hypothetical protein
MPPDSRSGPPLDRTAREARATGMALDVPTVQPAADKRLRCAHLYPGLTGCHDRAEPGSRYCARHQDRAS